MKIIKYLPFLLFLLPGLARAQTSTGSSTVFEISTATAVKMIEFSWASSSGGIAYDTTTAYYTGKIVGVMTNPGANAPTDDYDVELIDVDVNDEDVLGGNGLNRDTANTEFVTEANSGAVVNSRIALKVTNAGDSKGYLNGNNKIIIWIR